MPPMNVKNKTCLFCLKQRRILVNDSSTAKVIKDIYDIELPSEECRICTECHFNISRIREFKRTIEAATDLDVDSCFVCKSENTINEPGIDRVVDYLIRQCNTIDFSLTDDTVKACATCMYVLETSIKYEKLAKNYASAQRFCKQYSTLRECNIALWKIDLDELASLCDGGGGRKGKSGKGKKGNKRGFGSLGGEESSSKRMKKEDGSVLPVMLTKMTPTSTPTSKSGKKSLSPPGSKGKGPKQSDKIFIKLPLPSKLQQKKKNQQRKKFGPPHSPSRPIPAEPSVNDLNKIFNVELRQLSIRIEHVDLSNYLSKTIAHEGKSRYVRKPKKEEFIGLDEDDVVELQNTSVSSVGKRKSILITDRIESPNSAKKKVKFSDSPSIKYVDKVNFSDDESGAKDDSDDEKDADYADKKSKKKQNGASENGKPKRGRPKKIDKNENGEAEDASDSKAESEDAEEEKKAETSKETADESDESLKQKEAEKDEQKSENVDEVRSTAEETPAAPLENGKDEDAPEVPTDAAATEDSKSVSEAVEELPEPHKETPPTTADEPVAPMEAEDLEPSAGGVEPMKTDSIEDVTDAEMKDVNSPEDVEMKESSPTQDVEMKDDVEQEPKAAEHPSEDAQESVENVEPVSKDSAEAQSTPLDQTTAEFELSDKEEEELEQVKQTVNDLLGEAISDSDHQESQHSQDNEYETPKTESESEKKPCSESEQQDEQPAEPTSQPDPPLAESNSVEEAPESESPEKKNQSYSSLDDVDDISDDDDILNQLDEDRTERKRSPDLPPLGEDSL